MKYTTDRDGKSKTASAADAAHYPEQHEVRVDGSQGNVSHQAIAQRAYELWRKRGSPEGSAEQDWFDATEELRAAKISAEVQSASGDSGTVQP
jgi:hypothetical protein